MKKITLGIGVLIVLLMLGLVSAAITLYERYDTGDDQAFAPTNNTMGGQNFTVGDSGTNESFNIINVSLLIYRAGSPGQLDIFITGATSSGDPDVTDIKTSGFINGNDLATGVGGVWTNISMNSSTFRTEKGGVYFILMNVSSGNSTNFVGWRQDETSPTYTGGMKTESTDAGATWTADPARDQMFRIWGEAIIEFTFNEPTPQNNEQILIGNTTINITSDGLGNLVLNSSLWINGTLNETISFSNLTNTSLFIKNFSRGAWSFYINSCNNESRCTNSSTRIINAQNWVEHQTYFPSTSLVGSIERFGVELNLTSGLTISTANFVYNDIGSSPVITSLGNDRFNITLDFIIPSDTGDLYSHFNFTLSNGDRGNSTNVTTGVTAISVDNCTTNTFQIYNFSMFDEETQIRLSNGTIEALVNIFTVDRSSLVYNTSSSVNKSSIGICLSSGIPESVNYSLDATIRYTSVDYHIEYYNLQSVALGNLTTLRNISLFPLLNTTTPFILNFKGKDFLPSVDTLVFVKRQYVAENVFKVVELPKTDSFGNAVIHLVPDDVHYTLQFVKNNTILATFEDIVAFCDDPLLAICEINLNAFQSKGKTLKFSREFNLLISDLTYNQTTDLASITFLSTDGNSKNVTMQVDRIDNFGNKSICFNSLVSSGGDLTCSLQTRTDNSTAIISVFIDGELAIQSQASFKTSTVTKDTILIAFIVIIMFILMFSDASEEMLLFGVAIGFIISLTFGFIGGTGLGFASALLWLLVAIGIFIYQLNKGRPK